MCSIRRYTRWAPFAWENQYTGPAICGSRRIMKDKALQLPLRNDVAETSLRASIVSAQAWQKISVESAR
ncbi:hypothetical protein BAUCODRAFT_125958 [Baudoinia panamericana UAMH 10762]|uniref:Uncharacterized protein n=1 Tax=Baudoinia panamericana (strain UAMH 10762) TaxID=717646 RepID=M2MNK3_BAUPA|nr:uncharacterized protein BAUCODRAFT_125958 [Baudoinia panamericana UAMH 10762]EMC93023.1 hypothetical protein BAUCODRAFT_125958 [Baudoinia panamericana UAMH 10762]